MHIYVDSGYRRKPATQFTSLRDIPLFLPDMQAPITCTLNQAVSQSVS